jgi:hypothetical protein
MTRVEGGLAFSRGSVPDVSFMIGAVLGRVRNPLEWLPLGSPNSIWALSCPTTRFSALGLLEAGPSRTDSSSVLPLTRAQKPRDLIPHSYRVTLTLKVKALW